MEKDRAYPSEKSMGKDCMFWQGVEPDIGEHLGKVAVGCFFPKAEMEGRLSCEGVVDDVCLFLKDGRHPKSLTKEQRDELRFRIPLGDNRDIPPGGVV